jgi:phenylacetate-CoA oxygenase PaaH subunit
MSQSPDAWPLWEVFVRSKNGLAHKHSGSLHAPDAEGLQRARMNAVNARKGDPHCAVRIIANAAAVAAALDTPHEHTDALTWLCPNSLAQLQRPARAPLQVLDGPAILALARLQTEGWTYIRA